MGTLAPDISGIMAQVEGFPGIPATVGRLLTLLEDPETDVEQIEKALRGDVGLTANILRLANAAYFGFANQIGSVRQAVILLGARRLNQLVMTSCINAVMKSAVPGYELPAGELWRHSIAVSVTAEGLARMLDCDNVEEVFTAGLLHDVGKLVLGEFLARDLARVDDRTDAETSFEVIERQVLGADHAEVGAQILTRWSFPETLVRAVRYHHNPDAADPPANLIDIVHLANVLCLMIGIGVGREGLQYAPSSKAVARLGLRAMQFEQLASQTLQWVGDLMEESET